MSISIWGTSDLWCVHWTFGKFAFVTNAVEIYCTENKHRIQCTDVNHMVTAINDINGINKDTKYIETKNLLLDPGTFYVLRLGGTIICGTHYHL